ncbi:hypothetical protein AB6A40_004857 [Gnathostoma spinigerum]|uniref:Uncharacterized protein n=1 Tax=Gnathostoma spinigerum TaxID=75299 RepID=A0ABD6EMG0_9BILA
MFNVVLIACLYIIVFLDVNYANNVTSSNGVELPECVYIDPMEDLQGWINVKHPETGCNITSKRPAENIADEKQREKYKWGEKKFAYDVLASDKLGPKRRIEPQYHELCSNITYDQ